MTAPTTTWRQHSDELTPWQIDRLEASDRAAWSERPDRKAPTLLAIALADIAENAQSAVAS